MAMSPSFLRGAGRILPRLSANREEHDYELQIELRTRQEILVKAPGRKKNRIYSDQAYAELRREPVRR
jgi:hypothetical protein